MTRKPIGRRRKLPMERIENRSRRDVTFSKRRNGVFKKADELTTICGAEVALLFFSPAGKVHSFGSPDVNTIVNRLTMGGGGGGGGGAPSDVVSELNDQLTRIEEQLAAERKRGEELANTRRAAEEENRRSWWRPEYAGPLGLPELGRLRESMEDLKRRVVEQGEKQKRDEFAGLAAAMNTLTSFGNFVGGGPYAAGPSLTTPLIVSGAGPSSVNPNIGDANPYAAGPSSAIPLNFSAAASSPVNANLGVTDPHAAGPSSAAPPNINVGCSGFGYGPQGTILKT